MFIFKGLKLTKKNIGVFSVPYISSKESAKLRWVDRVAHLGSRRRSVGCNIAQKGAAYPEGAG